ncbi:MAG: phosphotransferase family protein [Deltaproteobacteria bacterium]|nr:phosphotransferase family protein [Deltaproteobacteria bacterium]
MTTDELRERLERFLTDQVGEVVRVDGLRKLAGGASSEIWSLDALHGATRLALVLRRDPGGSRMQTQRRHEYGVQQLAYAAGVPVPRPYWLADDAEALGAPSYLMARVEGETLARRLLRDAEFAPARAAMTGQLGAILARIHALDAAAPELTGLPAPPPGESPALAELDRYEQIFRGIAPEPHPAFELAFRWLRARLPDGTRRALVHGDYRIGNVVFGSEGVRAVLDWELAHIGDPAEDLGWLCVRAWRFGSDHLPVGGIGRREDLFAAYERAGGAPVDAARVRFWEVFGNLKWAVICIAQARTHLDGLRHSVELASLGRRTAETEWELLELIEAPD